MNAKKSGGRITVFVILVTSFVCLFFGSPDKVRGKANQISTIRGRKRTECPLRHAVDF